VWLPSGTYGGDLSMMLLAPMAIWLPFFTKRSPSCRRTKIPREVRLDVRFAAVPALGVWSLA
jgi:hypothetical protein